MRKVTIPIESHKIKNMNANERVKRALNFDNPDKVPIRHQALPAGLYEHGQKLINLWRKIPGDFGNMANVQVPHPEPKDITADGSYHRVWTDDWGVEWEEAVYGIVGHPQSRPLNDISKLKDYQPPPVPSPTGPEFEKEKVRVSEHIKQYYLLDGWINLFEIMHAVRKFEDVLVDIMEDTKEINQLADMIMEQRIGAVKYLVTRGCDGIMMADDWGSQDALLVSPEVWRRFFKPRYSRIAAEIKKAGVDVWYHTCGHILPLFDDLCSVGYDVLWPQLSANDNKLLAAKFREHKIAMEIHMDRQRLMPFGRPEEIMAAVKKARKIFDTKDGGIIWHAEIDNGVPYENVKALIEAFEENRKYL